MPTARRPKTKRHEILKLPPHCRAILNLLLNDFTPTEIADTLNLDQSAVAADLERICNHFQVQNQTELISGFIPAGLRR